MTFGIWIPYFWVSEAWPDYVRRARDLNDTPRAQRQAHCLTGPLLAMPAAERIAAWLVPLAATAAAGWTGRGPPAVVAICDCNPTVHALNKATSPNPHMNGLLDAARAFTHQWLGVHVPRDANKDADALTHPRDIERRIHNMVGPNLTPIRAHPPDDAWHRLWELMSSESWLRTAPEQLLEPAHED